VVIVISQLLYPWGKRPLYPSDSSMLAFVSNGTIRALSSSMKLVDVLEEPSVAECEFIIFGCHCTYL